ncbi:MAG: FHA domain-containing protein [Candidatus Nanopelagicales bacterium]|jgi:pSer/pThr/pTyr-binding forkhead associated (FHA) protein|nr:FHA domain-containing protein [Candidatus Nanopelagicales bacterium]
MSELLLSILRISFLVALWWFVLTVVSVLRRDLQAPRDAKPLTPARSTNQPSQRPTLRSRKNSTKLVIVEGALTGTVLPLGTSPILIGRAPDSTIVLEDDFVSTRHAQLTPNGNHWIVEDLGSTNGTWIDRTRISAPTVLRPGTQLRIGRTSMELGS